MAAIVQSGWGYPGAPTLVRVKWVSGAQAAVGGSDRSSSEVN
jgi:hypothetical protein